MRGKVLTYNVEKNFGFIKGQDGEKYFFHLDDWMLKESPEKGFVIEFETRSATKGPKAIGIKEVFQDGRHVVEKKKETEKSYELPVDFIFSKTEIPKYGKIVAHGSKEVFVETSDSPDEAKDELISKVRKAGGNALVNFKYSKRTGQSGNYRYSIHRFTGIPMFVLDVKQRPKGQAKKIEDYKDLIESFKNNVNNIVSVPKQTGSVFSVIFTVIVIFLVLIMIAG